MSLLERIRESSPEVRGDSGTSQAYRTLKNALRTELVDRLGLGTIATMLSSEDMAQVRSELSVTCAAILNDQRYAPLLLEERERLVGEVLDGICGLGPIQSLLDDDSVSEVIINGPDTIFFERDGQLCLADASFDSAEQVLMIIDRILSPLGRRLDRANPIVNARLANGDRVNAVADPVAIDGPAVTIRKFSNRIVSLDQLVELGSLPRWYAQLLTWAVRARKDIAMGIVVDRPNALRDIDHLDAEAPEVADDALVPRVAPFEDALEKRLERFVRRVNAERKEMELVKPVSRLYRKLHASDLPETRLRRHELGDSVAVVVVGERNRGISAARRFRRDVARRKRAVTCRRMDVEVNDHHFPSIASERRPTQLSSISFVRHSTRSRRYGSVLDLRTEIQPSRYSRR
jgi:pilus assembly protein CpaF